MKLIDYAPYYIGCKSLEAIKVPGQELNFEPSTVTVRTLFNVQAQLSEVKLSLRRLEDMTEEEMIELIQLTLPQNMQDRPTPDDYSIEMFYNDDGLMVDNDVLVGASYTCRCYDGQIAIKHCGTIFHHHDESGRSEGLNAPACFHYLLQQHFDLFNLIDAGLAVDQKTITQ
jgi:hypothetical protein